MSTGSFARPHSVRRVLVCALMGVAGRPCRVLLAEDDAALRELLASALRRDGHEVVEAATGNDLVDRVRGVLSMGAPIDLLISDVRMPKMSGLLVLKLLRGMGLQMPVVLITAFGDVSTRREAHELGAILLDKPVSLHVLRDQVNALLDCRAKSSAMM